MTQPNPPNTIPNGYYFTDGNPIAYGNTPDKLPQPDWQVSDDGKGMLTGTMKFYYNSKNNVPRELPTKGDRHPHDNRLECYDVQMEWSSNEICYVSANYIGLAQDPAGIEWEFNTPTSDEPIGTHPDFLTVEWGTTIDDTYLLTTGKPNWNTENVKLNEGDFEAFTNSATMVNNALAGVTAYKVPTATLRLSWSTAGNYGWALSGLGKTFDAIPLVTGNIGTGGGNWLLTSFSLTPYANIYKCNAEFTRSGGGLPWNPLIYKPAEGGGDGESSSGAGNLGGSGTLG